MNPRAAQLLSILDQRKKYLDLYHEGMRSIVEKSEKRVLQVDDVLSFEKELKDFSLVVDGTPRPMWEIKKIDYSTAFPLVYINSKDGHFKYKGEQLPDTIHNQLIEAISSGGLRAGGGITMSSDKGIHIGSAVNIDEHSFILNGKSFDFSHIKPKQYDVAAFDFSIDGDHFANFYTHFLRGNEEERGKKIAEKLLEKHNDQVAKELGFYQSDRHAKDLEFIKCLASDSCDCGSFE